LKNRKDDIRWLLN